MGLRPIVCGALAKVSFNCHAKYVSLLKSFICLLPNRLSAIAQASADQTLAKLLLYNVQAVQVLAHLYLSEGPVAMDGSPDVSFGVIEGGSVESTSWWVKQGVDTTLPVLPALGDIYASPDHSTTVTALASLIALAQQLQSGMPGMDGMVQALTSSQIFCRKIVNNNLAAGVEVSFNAQPAVIRFHIS